MTNAGIYKIINLKTDIIYIGSSIDLIKREKSHFNSLFKNKHENNYMQNAFNKIIEEYGKDEVNNYFTFQVIKKIKRHKDNIKLKEEILNLEQTYLNIYLIKDKKHKYIIDKSRCYNILPTAGSNLGVQRSEEFKKKVSESLKGIIPTQESLLKRSVVMKGKKFPQYIRDKVSKANKGKKRSEKCKLRQSKLMKGKKQSLQHVLLRTSKNKKKVINLGTMEIFNSIKDAANLYSIKSPSRISRVCKGCSKTAGGYEWRYLND